MPGPKTPLDEMEMTRLHMAQDEVAIVNGVAFPVRRLLAMVEGRDIDVRDAQQELAKVSVMEGDGQDADRIINDAGSNVADALEEVEEVIEKLTSVKDSLEDADTALTVF